VLYAFGFERTGVVLSDLYFVDPDPLEGQESAERGVRLEVRLLARGELKGSIYSAQPIEIGRPVWRVDLLESADGPPGTFDRTHHHPGLKGWEPGRRVFDENLSADPVGWLGSRLSDLEGLLEAVGLGGDPVDPRDAESLRECLPEVLAAVSRLLERVRNGELGRPPGDEPLASVRAGWL
jgi:hypothetical protein